MSVTAVSASLSCEVSKLRMVRGTPEIIISVRNERSHVGTCSLANFTEKVFPERNGLITILFNTRKEKSLGIVWGYLCRENRGADWKGTHGTFWGAANS